MLIAFIAGSIGGFLLAMPPGPIGVTAMRFGINNRVKQGTLFSAGSAFLDMFYCAIAVFTTSAFVDIFQGFTVENPLIFLIAQIAIIALIIVYGILHLKSKSSHTDQPQEVKKSRFRIFISSLSHKGPFLMGVALALTNIVNPAFMPALAYFSVFIHSFGLFENTIIANMLLAIGFGLGNFLWLYVIVRVLAHYKSKMPEKFLVRINQFAGFSLIGFGTILGYNVVKVTHWSEVLRLAFIF